MKHHGRPVEDLTGQRFGSLTVLHREPNQNGGRVGCANVIVETHARYSAGISNEEAQQVVAARKRTGNNRLDLTGRKFGRLLVLCPTENRSKRGSVCWKCRCDCGNKVEVSSDFLVEGICQSCGCPEVGKSGKDQRPAADGERNMCGISGKEKTSFR